MTGCPYVRNTPACAGNTVRENISSRIAKEHPRLRGEYLYFALEMGRDEGTPPLARGILHLLLIQLINYRNTPACAGNTLPRPDGDRARREHPRLRREYFGKFDILVNRIGTSPLAQGIRSNIRQSFHQQRNIPACAGNTLKNPHKIRLLLVRDSYFHLTSQTRPV